MPALSSSLFIVSSICPTVNLGMAVWYHNGVVTGIISAKLLGRKRMQVYGFLLNEHIGTIAMVPGSYVK